MHVIDIRNNASGQEYEANATLVIITSEVENKIAGCLLDSRGMHATICYMHATYIRNSAQL